MRRAVGAVGSQSSLGYPRGDSLTHSVRPMRESSYRVLLPVVRLDEVPLATGFLPGATFLESAALAFLAAAVAPEVVGRVRADGVRRRLATTLRTPGPGMRLVSSPVSHRTVLMAPLTAVTTPGRGTPFDATAIRSPTSAISVSLTERATHRLMVALPTVTWLAPSRFRSHHGYYADARSRRAFGREVRGVVARGRISYAQTYAPATLCTIRVTSASGTTSCMNSSSVVHARP